jgi:hypothetical protein
MSVDLVKVLRSMAACADPVTMVAEDPSVMDWCRQAADRLERYQRALEEIADSDDHGSFKATTGERHAECIDVAMKALDAYPKTTGELKQKDAAICFDEEAPHD